MATTTPSCASAAGKTCPSRRSAARSARAGRPGRRRR